MVQKKVWLGSTGPFLFDDAVLYIDEEGVIAPDNQQAIATNGQLVVQSAPSSPVHVIRKQDLDEALGDIASQEARIAALESGLAATNSNLATTNSNVATIQTSITSMNNTIYGVHGPKISTLETQSAYYNTSINSLNSKFLNSTFTMTYDGWTVGLRTVAVKYTINGSLVAIELPLLDGTSNAGYIVCGGFPVPLPGNLGNLSQLVAATSTSYGAITALATPSQYGGWDMEIRPAFVGGGVWAATGVKTVYPTTILFSLI